MIDVGMEAPDFSLAGTTGPGLRLGDHRGKKRTLLMFYPVDRTPG